MRLLRLLVADMETILRSRIMFATGIKNNSILVIKI